MRFCAQHEPVPKTVALLIGEDLVLLATRSLILQAAGYLVSSTSVQGAIADLMGGDFDVVILCHSVPLGDRERLTHLIRTVAPLTLVVSIQRLYGGHDTLSDANLEPDPRRFLSGLRGALQAEVDDVHANER